jgi:cation transporter-like permease
MFVVLVVLTLAMNGMFAFNAFLDLASALLAANLIAASARILVSFVVAILTFQKGWDPDNFVIPIEGSFADSMASTALIVSLIMVEWKGECSTNALC